MSGQFVNPIGADLYGLSGLGGAQGQPQTGYLQSRTPVGLDADTFQGSKPKKPDRLLLKWFNKNDTFLKASVNSLTAAAGGAAHYFRSMFWSKEEGFFRGLKTVATIGCVALAAAAGMTIAPAFTTAALAGLAAFGVGAGVINLGWSSLKWAGNMLNGKYNRAVEAAHDAGEAATDVATNLTGARQATNAVMRITGKTGTSNNPFNLFKMYGDLWDTVGNRNFFRNGLADAKLEIAKFKSKVRLYSEHEEVVKNFERLKTQHQQVNQKKAIETYKVYDIDGKRVYMDNPLLEPSTEPLFHSSYVARHGGKDRMFMRVKLELGAKEDPTHISKLGREFQTKYYDIMMDDVPTNNNYRIARKKVKDGNLLEHDFYYLEDGSGFTFDPNGQKSEILALRFLENTANLFVKAGKSLNKNIISRGRKALNGPEFKDIAGKLADDNKQPARVFDPTASGDDVKTIQTFTATEMDKARFFDVPFDGDIQPTLVERMGGIVKALCGFKDAKGQYHPGLFTNPEILQASGLNKTTNIPDGPEADMVAQALTRQHGFLKDPKVFVFEKFNSTRTHLNRQYLVRANGNDYIVHYEVPVTGSTSSVENAILRKQIEDNSVKFLRSAMPDSEAKSSWTNWWLGRSEKNRPVYRVETVSANPYDTSRTRVNAFLDSEVNNARIAYSPWTMENNMVSTGIVGAQASKLAPGKMVEPDNDSDEENNAEEKSDANTNGSGSTAPFNPFSVNYNPYSATSYNPYSASATKLFF